jgi:hypothetical protein
MDGADAGLPAIAEAHAVLAPEPTSHVLLGPRVLLPTAFVVLIAVALVLRAKKRGPVARAPRTYSVKRDRRNRRT